jgi:hypothetical protein
VFLSDLIHILGTSDGERRETVQLLMAPNVKGGADKQVYLPGMVFQATPVQVFLAVGAFATKSFKEFTFNVFHVCPHVKTQERITNFREVLFKIFFCTEICWHKTILV